MKPQIQLSIFLPETIPSDSAFPLTVATLRVIPPGRTSGTSSTFAIGLVQTDGETRVNWLNSDFDCLYCMEPECDGQHPPRGEAGEIVGYSILQDGERVDPETIDTLPEATARAILGITEFVIPQWLRDHLREYAQQGGLERAFARREGWNGR